MDPDYPVLSLVIEEENGGGVLGCSCFERIPSLAARARLERIFWDPNQNFRTVYEVVDFYVYQSDPHDPTYIRVYTNDLPQPNQFGDMPYIQIRERPVGADKNCSNLGPVFEPRPYFDESLSDIDNVIQTGERDFIGELRNKIPLNRNVFRTSWLPLFGEKSIVGRSLVLHDGDGRPVNCATITDDIPRVDLRMSLSRYF